MDNILKDINNLMKPKPNTINKQQRSIIEEEKSIPTTVTISGTDKAKLLADVNAAIACLKPIVDALNALD